MKIDTQGVLLLGAVALIMLKLAGVLTWPWLVVLIPAFVLFFPHLMFIAMTLGSLALGAMVVVGVGIFAIGATISDAWGSWRRRQRRKAQIKAGAAPGAWDHA